MSPDGSETKFKNEMAKQPLTLMIRIESGVQKDIENTHYDSETHKAANSSTDCDQKVPTHRTI